MAGSQNQDYLKLYKLFETLISQIVHPVGSRNCCLLNCKNTPGHTLSSGTFPPRGTFVLCAGNRGHQKPLVISFLGLLPSLSADCSEQKQYCRLLGDQDLIPAPSATLVKQKKKKKRPCSKRLSNKPKWKCEAPVLVAMVKGCCRRAVYALNLPAV